MTTKIEGLLERIDGVNSQINAALKLPTTPWPHSHKVIGLIGKKVYLLDGIVRLICERENEK